jgi:mono/diheme cytochrome c family protein
MNPTPENMLRPVLAAFVLCLAVFGFNATAQCQVTGKHDFDTLCAPCHGITGTGEGRDLTEANPPDITQLSRRNGGKFPFEEVYRTVDGRDMKGSHKRFGMPFWGDYLQKQDQKNTPVSDAAVKQRITAIVRFVETLQK